MTEPVKPIEIGTVKVRDLMRQYGWSETKARGLMTSGEIVSWRVGGSVVTSWANVNAYLQRCVIELKK